MGFVFPFKLEGVISKDTVDKAHLNHLEHSSLIWKYSCPICTFFCHLKILVSPHMHIGTPFP